MTMNHYRTLSALTVICFTTLPVAGIAEISRAPSAEEATATEFVTRDNSPQFVKDCETIDGLPCNVWAGECRTGVWLNPEEAKLAHAFLRRLLAEHPVRRVCRFHSRHCNMAEEDGITFWDPAVDKGPGFTIERFFGEYAELYYAPPDASEDSSMGTTFTLSRNETEEYYWVLADCLAEAEPELAEEFRQKATMIRGPGYAGYVVPLAALAIFVLVAIVSFWEITDETEIRHRRYCQDGTRSPLPLQRRDDLRLRRKSVPWWYRNPQQ